MKNLIAGILFLLGASQVVQASGLSSITIGLENAKLIGITTKLDGQKLIKFLAQERWRGTLMGGVSHLDALIHTQISCDQNGDYFQIIQFHGRDKFLERTKIFEITNLKPGMETCEFIMKQHIIPAVQSGTAKALNIRINLLYNGRSQGSVRIITK